MTISLLDLMYVVLTVCAVVLTVSVVISLNRLNAVMDELKKSSGHIAGLTATVDSLNRAIAPTLMGAVTVLKKFAGKAAEAVDPQPKKKSSKRSKE